MIHIMSLWREFYPESSASIRDYFCDYPYPNQEKIANYLENGRVKAISTDHGRDILTNEIIEPSEYIATDGQFTWLSTLPYYIRKYNVRLPGEYERKILNLCQ